MPIDTAALFAEAKSLGMYEERKPRKTPITCRRYNVIVDDNVIGQNCTINDVKILRNRYREQGKALEIVEVFALDSRGNDITKLPAPTLPEAGEYAVADVPGIQNFATPTLTERRQEALNARKRGRNLASKSSSIQRTIQNPWRMKNDPLYNDYMQGVLRDGFIVTNKNGALIYWGQRNEVIAYLKEYDGDITQIKATRITKKIRKQYGF
jgi:hypothetical protein